MKPVKLKVAYTWRGDSIVIILVGFTITEIAYNTTAMTQKILPSVEVEVNTQITQVVDLTHMGTLLINRFYLSINNWRDE